MRRKPRIKRVIKSISKARVLELIGEVDGVSLEGQADGVTDLTVFLEIGGKRIPLIRESGSFISHHITRIGITDELARSGIK